MAMKTDAQASDLAVVPDRLLVNRVLTRLGIERRPGCDVEGLTHTYEAWSKSVPFCSTRKRLHYGNDIGRAGPLPDATASEFYANFLAHGTGGTCWAAAEALLQLLRALGFEARRVAGSMLEFTQIARPNHGTVLVRIDGTDYLVDPFFRSRAPLPILTTESVIAPLASLAVRAEPGANGAPHTVHWRFPNNRTWMRFSFDPQHDGTTHAFFQERYEASAGANSIFNTELFISRHVGTDVHTLFKGEHSILHADDRIERKPIASRRDELLTDIFGLSDDVVRRLPEDVTGG